MPRGGEGGGGVRFASSFAGPLFPIFLDSGVRVLYCEGLFFMEPLERLRRRESCSAVISIFNAVNAIRSFHSFSKAADFLFLGCCLMLLLKDCVIYPTMHDFSKCVKSVFHNHLFPCD